MDANQIRKNHRYHFLDEDFVVSADEHDYIVNSLKEGKSQVILRDGNLIMNLSLGFSAVETDHLTDEQEKRNDERLKLGAPQWVEPSDEEAERRKIVLDSYKNTSTSALFGGGEKKNCTQCGENHYIPVARDMCLPCFIKTIKEGKVAAEKK